MVLCLVLSEVVLTFESVVETATIQLKATEKLLSCGAVFSALQGGSKFSVCG